MQLQGYMVMWLYGDVVNRNPKSFVLIGLPTTDQGPKTKHQRPKTIHLFSRLSFLFSIE